MHIRTAIRNTAVEIDKLTIQKSALKDAPPEELRKVDDEIRSVANRAELDFLNLTSHNAMEIIMDAREVVEDIADLQKMQVISDEAGEFLAQEVFEPLIARFGREITG